MNMGLVSLRYVVSLETKYGDNEMETQTNSERTIYILDNGNGRKIEVDASEEALEQWTRRGWRVCGWFVPVDHRRELERQARVLHQKLDS